MSPIPSIKCRIVSRIGPGVADGKPLPPRFVAHAGSCLRCQVELARYRKLRRELAALAQAVVAAPASFAPSVDSAIVRTSNLEESPASSRAVAAIASATAAAASVAVVALWRRNRAIA